jgi:hypothetical protein
LAETLQRYEDKVPEPLNRQFPERRNQEEAINRWAVRKQLRTELGPPGKIKINYFDSMMSLEKFFHDTKKIRSPSNLFKIMY